MLSCNYLSLKTPGHAADFEYYWFRQHRGPNSSSKKKKDSQLQSNIYATKVNSQDMDPFYTHRCGVAPLQLLMHTTSCTSLACERDCVLITDTSNSTEKQKNLIVGKGEETLSLIIKIYASQEWWALRFWDRRQLWDWAEHHERQFNWFPKTELTFWNSVWAA